MTGEEIYGAYRLANNSTNAVAMTGRFPVWKNLKPKTKKIWDRTATILNSRIDPHEEGRLEHEAEYGMK